MPTSLVVANPDATIRSVNKTTCELLGYREKELVGQPIEKIFGVATTTTTTTTAAAAAAAAAAAESIFKGAGLKKLIEVGTIRDQEMVYQTRKGEEIPVAVSGSVVRDQRGKLEYIVVVAKDMREIKKAEEEKSAIAAMVLKEEEESRQYSRRIVEAMVDSVIITDVNTRIIQANRATEELTGYKKGQLIGKPFIDFVADKKILELKKIIKTIFKKGIIANIETAFLTKDKKGIPAMCSMSSLMDSKGKLLGIVIVMKDMREILKLEEEKRKMEVAAAAAEKSKRELAEKMAGELEIKVKEKTTELESALEELKTIRAGLEKRVEERTAELAGKVAELEKWRKVTTGRELKMIELKEEIKRLRKKYEEPVGRIEKVK